MPFRWEYGNRNCAACHENFQIGEIVGYRDRGKPYKGAPLIHERCRPGRNAVPFNPPKYVPAEIPSPPAIPAPTNANDTAELATREYVENAIEQYSSDLNDSLTREIGSIRQGLSMVETTVQRELARCAPRRLEIIQPEKPVVTVEGGHFYLERLIKLLGAGIHVMLWGPAGTGKTTAAMMAAKALGLDAEIDTLDPSTPKSGIMGYRTPSGEAVPTAFTRCYSEGKVYVGDEVDNAPAHVQSIKNSAMANGHCPTAWGMVARAKGFVGCYTGNTPGRPTPQFPDRRPMSAAFADRLYFMYWPLDPNIERRAAGLPPVKTPEIPQGTCLAQDWVTWVQMAREYCAHNAPTIMITPRASIVGIQALAVGESPAMVADALVFRGADESLRAKVLNAVPLPTK